MNSNTALKYPGTGMSVTGFVLLLGYGLYNFFEESSLVLKVSIGAIAACILCFY